ncbi:alport syndrome [Pisolithus albus]|nr:alport syndrome [Pisolithus albus]
MSLLAVAGETTVIEDDSTCTKAHCFHAFDALYCALTDGVPIPPVFPDEKFPLFVTWNARSSRPGRAPRLRGCIGNFEPLSLQDGIAEYALISAFKDSRFSRIEEKELPLLECWLVLLFSFLIIRERSSAARLCFWLTRMQSFVRSVSLLTNFEDASSYLDWTIGTHGIYISFPDPALYPTSRSSSSASTPFSSSSFLPRFTSRRTLTATYLPDVIPAQGWDKIEAVESAMRKAGWAGPISEDTRRSVKLRRYQSSKCTVDWDDFVQWRRDNGDDTI